jgi:hypothetical protein
MPESDAALDWSRLDIALMLTLVLRTEGDFVVISSIDVLVGKLHGGAAAVHWDWQLAMAAPVPAQLHVPFISHPSTVPGSGSHGQQLEQHHRHSALSQLQPSAHPMNLLPTGKVATWYDIFLR